MTNVTKTKIQEESLLTVLDVNINEITPNVINEYTVNILDGHHTVIIPMNTNGMQFRAWHKGKGGIFSKDVLNYSLGLPHGKYVVINGHKLNCIARIISEDEELHFRTMKLVDGQIKDRPYMILKHLLENEPLSSVRGYVNEKGTHFEEIEYIPETKITSEDEEIDHPIRSISLFTE